MAGATTGLVWGVVTPAESLIAGVLAGIWIFTEMIAAAIALIAELVASALGDLFSGFSP